MHDAHVQLFKQRHLIAHILIAAFPFWLEARQRAMDRYLRGFA